MACVYDIHHMHDRGCFGGILSIFQKVSILQKIPQKYGYNIHQMYDRGYCGGIIGSRAIAKTLLMSPTTHPQWHDHHHHHHHVIIIGIIKHKTQKTQLKL